MSTQSSTLVQRLWNYCNVLHDDGISHGDYVERLSVVGEAPYGDDIESAVDVDLVRAGRLYMMSKILNNKKGGIWL